ncbi:hypothetical protein D1871_16055 [Nakamurella silvestris]|nr:hypothetical protein D1871_16055 [Nakamurella silvestris]
MKDPDEEFVRTELEKAFPARSGAANEELVQSIASAARSRPQPGSAGKEPDNTGRRRVWGLAVLAAAAVAAAVVGIAFLLPGQSDHAPRASQLDLATSAVPGTVVRQTAPETGSTTLSSTSSTHASETGQQGIQTSEAGHSTQAVSSPVGGDDVVPGCGSPAADLVRSSPYFDVSVSYPDELRDAPRGATITVVNHTDNRMATSEWTVFLVSGGVVRAVFEPPLSGMGIGVRPQSSGTENILLVPPVACDDGRALPSGVYEAYLWQKGALVGGDGPEQTVAGFGPLPLAVLSPR